MFNIIRFKSTISYPTQIQVDGEANFHAVEDKHLFYILFFRSTYVHFSGRSTLLSAGVVLVHFMFPGSSILEPFAPAYWNPTDRTNTLSISSLNFIMVVLGHPMKLSHLVPSVTPKTTLFRKNNYQKNLEYINLHIIKNYQSHPTGQHCLLSPSIVSMSRNRNA